AIAAKRAAEMTADIEAGPVIDGLRRRIGRCLGVGARRKICCKRRCGEECNRGGGEQEFLHDGSPFQWLRPSSNNVARIWLLEGGEIAAMVRNCGTSATSAVRSKDFKAGCPAVRTLPFSIGRAQTARRSGLA